MGYLQDPIEKGELVYHYTDEDKLKLILNSGNIRFGMYENTNDPKENKNWNVVITGGGDNLSQEEWRGYIDLADSILRRAARLACFSNDQDKSELLPGEDYPPFHRGWARPRMWAQYGGNHKGACLVFKKSSLVEKVYNLPINHPPSPSRPIHIIHGDVVYRNNLHRIYVSLEELRKSAINALHEERDRGIQDRFFSKYRDWSSEMEFRFVVLASPDHPVVDIPFEDSIEAIIIGDEFPDSGVEEIFSLLSKRGLESIPVARCSWFTLAPALLPPR